MCRWYATRLFAFAVELARAWSGDRAVKTSIQRGTAERDQAKRFFSYAIDALTPCHPHPYSSFSFYTNLLKKAIRDHLVITTICRQAPLVSLHWFRIFLQNASRRAFHLGFGFSAESGR